MAKIVYILLSIIALSVAALFAVRFSTLPQSWSLLVLLVLVAGGMVRLCKRDHVVTGSFVLWIAIISVFYFTARAYCSVSIDLAVEDMFVFSALVFGFVSTYILRDRISFYKPFICTVAALTVLNLLMYVPAINNLRDELFGYAAGKWNTGFFGHRNFFCNFMALCSCILLSNALFSPWSSRSRWVLGLLGCGAAIAVFIPMARGGILGWLAGVIVIGTCFLIFRTGTKRFSFKLIGGVSILLVIITSVLALQWVFKERDVDMSSDSRMIYYSMAVDQIVEAPFLGSGSRSIEYKSYQYWHPELYTNLDFKFTHNEFLQVTADYGIIGLLLMLLFILAYIYTIGSRILNKLEQEEGIFIEVAGMSCLVVIAVNSLVSFPLHAFPNVLLLGMIIGLSLSTRPLNPKSSPARFGGLAKWGVCSSVFILMVFVAPFVLKENRASVAFLKQGIVVDDGNWSDEDTESHKLEVALEDATKVSSTYSRENKLGFIYLNKYYQTKNKSFLKKAEHRFLKAKSRHPEDPICRLNLGYIYRQNNEFEKAISEYKEVEYMVIKRENQFEVLLNSIELEVAFAELKVSKQQVDDAILLLESALKKCRKRMTMRVRRNSRFLTEYERALVIYQKLLFRSKDKEKNYAVMDEYMMLTKKRFPHTESEILVNMCLELVIYARQVWVSNRDPQRAVNVLSQVSNTLYQLRLAHPEIVNNPKWKKAKLNLVNIQRTLHTAGFKAETK